MIAAIVTARCRTNVERHPYSLALVVIPPAADRPQIKRPRSYIPGLHFRITFKSAAAQNYGAATNLDGLAPRANSTDTHHCAILVLQQAGGCCAVDKPCSALFRLAGKRFHQC